jgi:hypothetical protein
LAAPQQIEQVRLLSATQKQYEIYVIDNNYCKIAEICVKVLHILCNFGVVKMNPTPKGYETDNHSLPIYTITHHGISVPFIRI